LTGPLENRLMLLEVVDWLCREATWLYVSLV